MLNRDLDRGIVTYFLYLLKFKSYINTDCSKVPSSGNSFHIETGHLHCKLICWFLFVGSFVKRFSKQVINRFLGPIDVLKLQGILAVLFHWTNSFFISFLVNKVLAQMYIMPTRNKPLIMKLMTT